MSLIVREVWDYNLMEEISALMEASSKCDHCFVAMSTNFPSNIFTSKEGKEVSPYNLMKFNVEATCIIQLGLALCDANGKSFGVWEFNFKDFDERIHSHHINTIELLKDQEIYFDYNGVMGIDSLRFARLILKSGLLSNSRITWVMFHSDYDFGYFIKMLTGGEVLPLHQSVYVKHMIKFCDDGVYAGSELEIVAKTLGLDREVGRAGSESLLTLQTFMKLEQKYFNGRSLSEFEHVLHDFT
ncbi:probable CCR4-associated factor 1 homolog 9 [Corylus avellana]|uniref:probable CCR4-associated factor 1 homolog 9 n=1 Tax=Corylus avellana TaxID=13451 RepID=UPI00286B9881|nr:probable CCR4-associated factor 1 homolog 9 [Corylus avellana]